MSCIVGIAVFGLLEGELWIDTQTNGTICGDARGIAFPLMERIEAQSITLKCQGFDFVRTKYWCIAMNMCRGYLVEFIKFALISCAKSTQILTDDFQTFSAMETLEGVEDLNIGLILKIAEFAEIGFELLCF